MTYFAIMEQNKTMICHSKIEAFKSIYAKSRELKRENEKQYKKFNYEIKKRTNNFK